MQVDITRVWGLLSGNRLICLSADRSYLSQLRVSMLRSMGVRSDLAPVNDLQKLSIIRYDLSAAYSN